MKLKAFLFYAGALLIVGIIIAWAILTARSDNKDSDGESYDPLLFARLGEEEIFADEVNHHLNLMRLRNPRVTQRNALDDLIRRRIYLKEAAERGIEVGEEEVDQFVESARQQYQEQLAQKNITLDDLRREIRAALLKNKLDDALKKELRESIQVSEDEIKDYYDRKKETDPNFTDAEIALIFVQIRTDADAARAKAEMIIDELAQGTVFEELARLYSDHSASKRRGGYIGDFHEVAEELQLETLKLEPGQHSKEPLNAPKGFYTIIKCLNKQQTTCWI